MNRVELVGGLVRDPDVGVLPGSGTFTWSATIAVNGTRYSREEGGHVVKTTYVSLSAIGWAAEQFADLGLTRGDEVYVLGELDQYERETADGKKERKTRVTPLVLHATRLRQSMRSAAPSPAFGPEPPF